MKEITDKELLAKFKQKDTKDEAFRQLVHIYQQRVYWHVRRMVINHEDANDVTQNTFIKAWKGLENFREDAKLFTWLYRIGTNESITFLNKKKKEQNVSIDDVQQSLANTLQSDTYFSGDEIQLKLQQALLTLPEKQRLVFNMKYYDDMKYEEISEVLGTSVGSLKASYHHAVKKIESFFDKD